VRRHARNPGGPVWCVAAPEPPLEELVDGWTVEVALNGTFVRTHRMGKLDKVIRIDFLSSTAP